MGGKLQWMIIGIVTVFFFSGCASLKCLDGSCERQIQVLTITNDEMKKELTRLEADVKEKDKALQSAKEEVAKLQSEKAALTAQVKDLQEYIEKQRQGEKAAAIKTEAITEKEEVRKAEAASQGETLAKPLRIKVLSGDGRLASARKMAQLIEKTGLKVEIVDHAPRSNFAEDTIYYTADAEKEAKEIAKSIGGKAVLKPVTWSSSFNIIAVTGKKK
ncbi:MAG TPA: LytR C-terminal domain-containing protein [Syntrophales bacterium]|nr:LytR C-terminal domain-containing protein [Syntrophobacterales bacterium]HRR40822.1 LytR C-terminal domain-containing protein [Syntrophales bacterium]HRT26747.1 LytR C-terminal domain-containing protein [Syntrophales bacterium]HRT71350.1 LytR C-terminal domain-containing protein [Syntrophales bacterium]